MSNKLNTDAVNGVLECPGLWLRGLVPWTWTFGKVAEELEGIAHRVKLFGPWSSGVWQLPDGALAGTDGSGGKHAKAPGLEELAGEWLLLARKTWCLLGGLLGLLMASNLSLGLS